MNGIRQIQKRCTKMIGKLKGHTILFYFFISIFYMESVFRVATVKNIAFKDLILSFIFLSTYMIVIYFIASFFRSKARYVLSCLSLGLIAFIYLTQLIYYQFFKTFYSAYSVGNSPQVFEFWKDIGRFLLQHSIWIFLIILPVFVLILFGKGYFTSIKRIGWMTRMILVFSVILTHLIGMSVVYAGGKEQHSAYDLYYKENFPLLSVQRLGLLTTMRLDLQRLLIGWSPTLDEPPIVANPTDTEDTVDGEEGGKNDESNPSGKKEDNNNAQEEEKEPEYNVMDIDFSELAETESDATIKDLHEYFENIEPTKKNDYTGKYEGYNLILLTAEGFSPYAVHEEVTPTLYKMVNQGYRFANFYTPIWEVSTSDGEYVALNSLLPKSGVWSFEESGGNDVPFVLGHQLKKLGYKTNAYHNHTYTYYGRDLSHPNMGYDYKALGNGLEVEETWPESDLEMMEKTVSEYINDEPFHAYYMTVSGHMQYSFTGNYIAWKNQKLVDDLAYSEQAKAYLATQIELDRALKYLLEQLEEHGVAEKTLIALSADHYPYGLDDETIDEFAGHPVEENFELYKNNFILYTKGMEPETIMKPASSMDILPTLSNLLGLEYDSRLLMGTDIFSDADPIITFLNQSFITNKGSYNSITKEFIENDGEQVDDDYVDYVSSIVKAQFYYSAKVLETDYYRSLFKN